MSYSVAIISVRRVTELTGQGGPDRMMTQRAVSRRAFLGQAALGLAGGSLLAACRQRARAAKPADAPKPADAKPAAPAATAAPAAGATSAPAAAATTAPAAAAKPAEAARPAEAAKPAAAAKPDAPLGSQFVGKLEGPEV